MNVRQLLPIEPLRRYIRYFWVLEDDCAGVHKTFKIIPDGLPGLIFQEKEKTFFDTSGQSFPQLFLYGQTTKHTENKAMGKFRNMGESTCIPQP